MRTFSIFVVGMIFPCLENPISWYKNTLATPLVTFGFATIIAPKLSYMKWSWENL